MDIVHTCALQTSVGASKPVARLAASLCTRWDSRVTRLTRDLARGGCTSPLHPLPSSPQPPVTRWLIRLRINRAYASGHSAAVRDEASASRRFVALICGDRVVTPAFPLLLRDRKIGETRTEARNTRSHCHSEMIANSMLRLRLQDTFF